MTKPLIPTMRKKSGRLCLGLHLVPTPDPRQKLRSHRVRVVLDVGLPKSNYADCGITHC